MALGDYGGPGGGYGGGTGPGTGTGGGAGAGQGSGAGRGQGGETQDRQSRARQARGRERAAAPADRQDRARESRRAAQAAVLDQFGYSRDAFAGRSRTRGGPTVAEVAEHNRMDRAARFDQQRERERMEEQVAQEGSLLAAGVAGIVGLLTTGNPMAAATLARSTFKSVQERAPAVAGVLSPEPTGLTSFMGSPTGTPTGTPDRAAIEGVFRDTTPGPGPAMGPGGEGRQRPAPSAAEAAPAQARPAAPGLETERVIGQASRPVQPDAGAPGGTDGALGWLRQMRADIRRSEERIVRI